MAPIEWRGVFPALTTKFTDNDELDFDAMARHLEFQLDAGVHGIIILGSLGENSTLCGEEKREMIRFFAERLDGRAPLVPCIAESGTREAIALARDGVAAGADGFMLLPPMRYHSDPAETRAYLRAVATATDAPIMLYNNPLAYGIDLLPEDFAALADLDNVKAIKESSADTRRLADIRREVGDRYALFCGVDDLAFESFAMGAVGWVAGLVVAFPRETVAIWALCQAGEWGKARAIYEWFLPLLHLDVGARFVQQIKYVEECIGVGSARVRAPRLALPAGSAAGIDAIVEQALATRPAL
ncbi:dihydrodipicolinate synthase family protein [Marinihelvus fidelis]|uniref:Dihydrodipicolinate synthase family protein n=1 Tax=Marinihelvus fidelis TaxID=2613842 RepID=A0A5N0TDK6_9GAMM|nr:dihydrodipicolinate synthase family protein [Marinihelvus fidelis]KAA9131379.1 dihydrodipicolinate synthase family protein [Marinihelvus fidelis]